MESCCYPVSESRPFKFRFMGQSREFTHNGGHPYLSFPTNVIRTKNGLSPIHSFISVIKAAALTFCSCVKNNLKPMKGLKASL